MVEDVKDEVGVQAIEGNGPEARGFAHGFAHGFAQGPADGKRSIFKSAVPLAEPLAGSLAESLSQPLTNSIYLHPSSATQGVAPVYVTGPHKFYSKLKQGPTPMTILERDIPWKLVFVLYAFFAVGGLVLFGVFLVTMIRIYKQAY